jgi:hypothetical protein
VSDRAARFVTVPLRVRREHRNWSAAEHAAWLDLLCASYEVGGYFDSPDVARAFLGSRAGALDALIARRAFVEIDGDWLLVDYHVLYDERRLPRRLRTIDEHLATAEQKIANGVALSPIERWARWKARRDGAVLPDPRVGRTLARANAPTMGNAEGERTETERETEQTLALAIGSLAPRTSDATCPDCGARVVVKKGKRGAFRSCSRYPDCSWSDDLDELAVPFDKDADRRLSHKLFAEQWTRDHAAPKS